MAAPHTLGAAVDLTLSYEGKGIALGSDFDDFTPAAALHYLELRDDLDSVNLLCRDLRRLLASVMTAAGFAPLGIEWWHWSCGDQRWAVMTGSSSTLYSARDTVE